MLGPCCERRRGHQRTLSLVPSRPTCSALNAARGPDGFAAAALLLGEYRKLHPGPIEELVLFDHPSGYTRILAAMRFKAVQE